MMKMFRRTGFAITAGMLSLAVLFSACKKNNESQSVPVSGLMAYNLAPDKYQVSFSLSGNLLTYAPLAYSNFTGYYLNVYPGPRTVETFDQSGNIAATPVTFEANKYYSAFLLGANGTYQNVVVHDNIDTLTAPNGVAYIRYVNAVPDSSKPAVTVLSGGTTVVNSQAGFGSVSGFIPIAPGDIVFTASNEGNINASRTITLESKKVYTILIQGLPGQTDPERTVQVRYITNGMVTP